MENYVLSSRTTVHDNSTELIYNMCLRSTDYQSRFTLIPLNSIMHYYLCFNSNLNLKLNLKISLVAYDKKFKLYKKGLNFKSLSSNLKVKPKKV